MKKKYLSSRILSLLFLSFTACIQINILPSRQDHNGFSDLSEKEQNRLEAFDQNTSATFTIQELNGTQLQQLISQNKYTWVSMWATWCASCIDQMPNEVEIAKKYQDKDLKIIYVSSNYDIKNIEKFLKRAGYSGTAYIIDRNTYQQSQKENILAFRKDVAPTVSSQSTAMPHHYFFKGSENIYYKEGRMEEDKLRQIVE